MMTLRILTGHHAGVQVSLSSSASLVAASDDADIQLIDWKHEPITLTVMADHVIASPVSGSQSGASAGMRLDFFMPRRFGDIALCVGRAGEQWPSDVQLFERLNQPEDGSPVVRPRRINARVPAFALSVLSVLALSGIFIGDSMRSAQAQAPQEPLIDRVQHIVSEFSGGTVTVRNEGERVVIEGLMPTSEDVNALRVALSKFPSQLIDHRYASVAQISQSIIEAMRLPGATVTYVGGGDFVLTAAAVHPEQASREVARVAADLAPFVKNIELAVEALPAPGRVAISAALSSDGVKYVQMRDGAKYLELSASVEPPRQVARRTIPQNAFSSQE